MKKDSKTCRGAYRTSRKVSQLVGYEPKVQLNEIITKVIEYFRAQGS